MRNRGWLVRRWLAGMLALAVAAVGFGVVAAWGATTGGRARPRAAAAAFECRTEIRGTTEIRSDHRMDVTDLTWGRGVTMWVHYPRDVFRGAPRSWGICAESNHALVHIGYEIVSNGDRVSFSADFRRGGHTTAGCSFKETRPSPREYECEAEISETGADSGVAVAKFILKTLAR
jgi:hypothetical protein